MIESPSHIPVPDFLVKTKEDLTGLTKPVTVNPLAIQIGGNHYRNLVIQPVEFIHANGLGFLEGCIVKRISRWRDKGGIQDLQKIKHECDLLIELETKGKEI